MVKPEMLQDRPRLRVMLAAPDETIRVLHALPPVGDAEAEAKEFDPCMD